jgi:hypothetical protein
MDGQGGGSSNPATPKQDGGDNGRDGFDASGGFSLSDSRRAAAFGLSASRRKCCSWPGNLNVAIKTNLG